MQNGNFAGLLAAVLFAAAGCAVLVWRFRRRQSGVSADGTSFACAHCLETMVVSARTLTALSPVEKGLIVRSKPEWVGQPIAEFVCPNCGGSHVFGTKSRKPVLLGTNFYQPHRVSAHCGECRTALEEPAWDSGGEGPSLTDIHARQPRVGLKCTRCGSVCCIDCCVGYTRNRTADKSLKCPRCDRGPLTAVFFPQRDLRNL